MTRMATCSIQPSNLDHQNLTESLVALYYTKEGLEDFVMDEITQFQRDTLNAIAIKHNLPKGIKCNSCTTANILPCRTVGYCTTGGRCQVHNVKDPALKSDIPCKNNICKDFREMIRREHRFYLPNKTEPSWKNADATKFCSDPFQILKCFLPLEGYNNKQNIKDIDFNGIINAVINCKVFQNKLSAKLFQKRNVFVEARDIGRNIRHLSNLSVSDTEKAKYINTLIQLLSDRKYLVSNSKAKDAVTKLQMLKANGLPPNEETKGIINAVYGYIKSTEAKHIEMTEQAAIELQQKIQKGEKSASKHLENHVMKAVMKIERKSKIELKKLERVGRKTKLEIQNASKPFRTCIDVKSPPSSINLKTDIPGGTYQQHISERKVMSPYSVDFDYERLKEDFRRDLLLYYGDVYNTIAATPLIEEHNVSPLNLYVEPKLQSVDIAKYCNQLENTPLDTNIKSFQDLFFNGPNPCKNIYSKNPQLRPPSGLDQSGLNCGVVLIVDILIIAYTLHDNGLFWTFCMNKQK